MNEHETCENCRHCYSLVKYDYTNGGCKHTELEGYACTALSYENVIVQMIMPDGMYGVCECFEAKG